MVYHTETETEADRLHREYVFRSKTEGVQVRSGYEQCKGWTLYAFEGIIYRFWSSGAYAGAMCAVNEHDLKFFKIETMTGAPLVIEVPA